MGGRLIIKPAWVQGRLPQEDALFLVRGKGLGRFPPNGRDRPIFSPVENEFELGPELEARIARWVMVWRKWSSCLPKRYTPLDCREFDIQRFNREALAICREVAPRLPEDQEICFNGVKRTGVFHRTWMMEAGLPGRAKSSASPEARPRQEDPDKVIKLMAEYGGEALWGGRGPILPDDLPISQALQAEITQWGRGLLRATESWLPGDDDSFQRYQDHDDRKRLHAERGTRLARALSRELPDWTVIYFNSDLADRHADPNLYYFTYAGSPLLRGSGKTA
jgi:hypothetical protein